MKTSDSEDGFVAVDEFERIIRPIVEGQIRGFLKEHPKIVNAVDWYKPRKDKATTFTNSLAKRIVRDLCCPITKGRLVVAALAIRSEPQPEIARGTLLLRRLAARLALVLSGPLARRLRR